MGDEWTTLRTGDRDVLWEHVEAAPADDVKRIEWWLRRENLRVQLH
jgi:hypothetical protein